MLLPQNATGLSKDSVANISQVLTIDKGFLAEKISRLPNYLLEQVEDGCDLSWILIERRCFIERVENDVTLGEICNTLRGVWGEYVVEGLWSLQSRLTDLEECDAFRTRMPQMNEFHEFFRGLFAPFDFSRNSRLKILTLQKPSWRGFRGMESG